MPNKILFLKVYLGLGLFTTLLLVNLPTALAVSQCRDIFKTAISKPDAEKNILNYFQTQPPISQKNEVKNVSAQNLAEKRIQDYFRQQQTHQLNQDKQRLIAELVHASQQLHSVQDVAPPAAAPKTTDHRMTGQIFSDASSRPRFVRDSSGHYHVMAHPVSQLFWRQIADLINDYLPPKQQIKAEPSTDKGIYLPVTNITFEEANRWVRAINILSESDKTIIEALVPDHEPGDVYSLPLESDVRQAVRGPEGHAEWVRSEKVNPHFNVAVGNKRTETDLGVKSDFIGLRLVRERGN